jgi:hypothetical protein
MPSEQKLQAFIEWFQANITGDEKGEAQVFLDRLFQRTQRSKRSRGR